MKTKEQTKVIFRTFPDGEVIALFPEIPSGANADFCMSYMHVGQHASATPSLMSTGTKPSTAQEYAPLKKELETLGYSLAILSRFPKRARAARLAEINRYQPA